jgi:hypothetical protein
LDLGPKRRLPSSSSSHECTSRPMRSSSATACTRCHPACNATTAPKTTLMSRARTRSTIASFNSCNPVSADCPVPSVVDQQNRRHRFVRDETLAQRAPLHYAGGSQARLVGVQTREVWREGPPKRLETARPNRSDRVHIESISGDSGSGMAHTMDMEMGLGKGGLSATDFNGDGLMDIAVGSKHGVFLFFQQ